MATKTVNVTYAPENGVNYERIVGDAIFSEATGFKAEMSIEDFSAMANAGEPVTATYDNGKEVQPLEPTVEEPEAEALVEEANGSTADATAGDGTKTTESTTGGRGRTSTT